MGGTHAIELTIDQFLKDYRRKRNLDHTQKPKLFALCCVDTLIGRYVRKPFDVSSVFVDGQNDTGIDGLAIIVNGESVSSALKRGHVSCIVGVPALWDLLKRRILGRLSDRSTKLEQLVEALIDILSDEE